jgi:beta-glucanase (GH16 family)
MYNYTSGWVDSNFLFGQREGRWEVRAKLPDPSRQAIWPAIWLMNCGSSALASAGDTGTHAVRSESSCRGPELCWPRAGEIDIMEMVGMQQNGSVLSTYHWAHECNVDQCAAPRHVLSHPQRAHWQQVGQGAGRVP